MKKYNNNNTMKIIRDLILTISNTGNANNKANTQEIKNTM